ncbi:MAG: hypothetical protein ABIJ11_03285, partial [Elusimicrobiota bacterium]
MFGVKSRTFKNKIRNLTAGGWFKLGFGIFTGLLFLSGLYAGFCRMFFYIQKMPFIGTVLLLKFLEIAFLTTFVMVIFSSIVISFTSMFFADDLNFLLTLPVQGRRVFVSKAVETVFQSSWMMMVVLVPFLAAFAFVKNVGLSFFVVFGLAGLPFFFIGSAIGIMISMSVMYFFPSSRVRDMALVAAVAAGSLFYVALRFFEPEKLANPDAFYTAMQYIAYLDAPVARFLPSWWLAEVLKSVIVSNAWGVIRNLTYLFSVAGALFLFLVIISGRMYYTAVCSISASVSKSPLLSSFISKRRVRLNFILKDAVSFLRDTKQWSQVLLVMALTIVYLFSIYKLPQSFTGDNFPAAYIRNFLSFVNIGAAGFIISALALRFVFPQVSLEKGTLWFVMSVPFSIEKFLLGKFVFCGVPLIILSVVIGVVSNSLLGVSSAAIFLFSTAGIVLVGFGLLCMALGFGAMYPRFDTENIAQIETSYGGILYMITSVLYVGLTLAIGARPMQLFLKQELGVKLNPADIVWYGVDLLLLNAIVIFVPLWFGLKALKR